MLVGNDLHCGHVAEKDHEEENKEIDSVMVALPGKHWANKLIPSRTVDWLFCQP